MRKLSRIIAAICLALSLLPVLASPAFAAREVIYRGRTSAPPDNPSASACARRRTVVDFFNGVGVDLTITCEDATTELWSIGFGWAGRGDPIQEGGRFFVQFEFGGEFFALEGDIDFGQASGTVEWTVARLTQDHLDAQICTTGELTWTADRKGSRPARLAAASVPDGTGFLRVRVTDGVAEVVNRVEP